MKGLSYPQGILKVSQGYLKLSSSPQVYQRYVLGRTQGNLPKNSPEMAVRYPQSCSEENVDPMVGPVARPDGLSTTQGRSV